MDQDFEQRGVFFPALMGAVLGGVIVGAFFMWFVVDEAPSQEDLMLQAYMAEEYTSVSPVAVRQMLETGDAEHVIVDVRAAADYERGHIVTAHNIPAGTLSDEALADAFEALPEGKTPVLYCYSASCTLAVKTAHRLAHAGIFVKHMTIGWNEWRYDWQMWNGVRVTTSPLQYSDVGTEPGVYRGPKTEAGCAVGGGEGC